ncbi:MAG: DUF4395 domain-containing protein [Anaerolineales bacterium]|nr:DUF4395 domain-containing protein [Anaerolineales bacterium]
MEQLQKIDHSAMTVNQVIIIALNFIAFVLNQPWLVALVTAFMLLGTLLGKPGFGFLYHSLLKPTGWVKPHVLLDNPEPHRFAQGLGGLFMLSGTLALFGGWSLLGWGLVWMVAALAALNAFGGFCVGCFVYYWLTRLGVPGFSKTPPAGTFPGMRPKSAVNDER